MKINKLFTIGVILTTLLLCAPTVYAQDVVVSKPTLPAKPEKPEKPTKPTSNSTSTSTSTSNSNSESTPTPTPPPPPTTGTINGHQWVDLGLSVKWATCNIGATRPSDYSGNRYAWGETESKSEHTEKNSATFGKDMGSIAGNPAYDAARANWGETWRLPTKAEIDELINKCKWQWTKQGGHNGYKITGPNGNSIFLPATGWCKDIGVYNMAEDGVYWSATPYEDDASSAYSLDFNSGDFHRSWSGRYYGLSVRPVSE